MINSFCVDFSVDTTWGIPGTFPQTPATLSAENIIGRFNAFFVCTVSLDYLYDADGLVLKDSEDKTLITD